MTEHTKLISDWLASPHLLSPDEQLGVTTLLERYPYLVPARMMQSGTQFATNGFSREMLEQNNLFAGNWLYFYNKMKSSVDEKLDVEILTNEAEEAILDEEETLILDEVLPPSENEGKKHEKEYELIQPLFIDNYFQHQGISVPDNIPQELDNATEEEVIDEKALMVMMGFEEWLLFLKKKNDAKKSDEEDKAIVRSIWQREKLAAAMGEEDDNIPEAVFEMAINSIDRQDIMISEPLAEIHAKQGRYDKAIEIYRKLSLQNPEKKTYFAAKINHLNKENLS